MRRIRIFIGGTDAAIGTSLVVPGLDEALTMANRLSRPLGWTRAGWTAFAAKRVRRAGALD